MHRLTIALTLALAGPAWGQTTPDHWQETVLDLGRMRADAYVAWRCKLRPDKWYEANIVALDQMRYDIASGHPEAFSPSGSKDAAYAFVLGAGLQLIGDADREFSRHGPAACDAVAKSGILQTLNGTAQGGPKQVEGR